MHVCIHYPHIHTHTLQSKCTDLFIWKSVHLCACTQSWKLMPSFTTGWSRVSSAAEVTSCSGRGALHAQAWAPIITSAPRMPRGMLRGGLLRAVNFPKPVLYARSATDPATDSNQLEGPGPVPSIMTPLITVSHQPHPTSSSSSFYFYFSTYQIALNYYLLSICLITYMTSITFLEIKSHVPPELLTAPSIVLTISTQ